MYSHIKIFIGSLLCIELLCHAFIYHIDILRQWKPMYNHYQYILCLSDFHDKSHPETDHQLTYLKRLLNTLAHKNIYVLVEDLSSPNTITGLAGCGNFSIDSRGGILGGFSATCKNKGIPVDNVEYRFCRVAAFGPVLNNLTKPLNSLPPAHTITMNAIQTEIEHTIQRIQSFHDGPIIQHYYDINTEQVRNELTRLHIDTQSQKTIANYLTQQAPPMIRQNSLKHLLTFDSSLLDIQFVHLVIQAQDKNIIVIIAGGAHITNVCELLQKIDYEHLYKSPLTYTHEHNLSGCIGSRIVDENYCVKPQAADLHEIDQFIDGGFKNQ